jgi:hypothetical protein
MISSIKPKGTPSDAKSSVTRSVVLPMDAQCKRARYPSKGILILNCQRRSAALGHIRTKELYGKA